MLGNETKLFKWPCLMHLTQLKVQCCEIVDLFYEGELDMNSSNTTVNNIKTHGNKQMVLFAHRQPGLGGFHHRFKIVQWYK